MKKLILALFVAVPMLASTSSSTARADGCGCGPCGFMKCICGHHCGIPLDPWYTYWPYKAHFQTPAMPEFPYWPAPMTSSLQTGYGHGYGYQPAPAYTPVGYYQNAPQYWYGH